MSNFKTKGTQYCPLQLAVFHRTCEEESAVEKAMPLGISQQFLLYILWIPQLPKDLSGRRFLLNLIYHGEHGF